ncbi:MAG: hypothetical protein M3487_13425 [Actinomycetota bacterium]|nr:hypothetical protein [Actinomycetota bacterium]
MLGRDNPTNTDPADGSRDDEARIRADERADVERELHALGDDPGDRDRDRDGVDDRIERDDRDRDRDGRDDRLERDRAGAAAAGAAMAVDARHDRDRDGVDDRLERDDRDGVFVREDEPIEVLQTRSFSFGQLLTLLAGAALVALGVFALIQTGLDTPLTGPENAEDVLGWNHTPMLGIVEIVAGALLLLFALRPGGRWLVALVGAALVVGGVMILGELDYVTDDLGAEQSFAWVPIVAGAIALFASVLTPRRHKRVTGMPVIQ